MTAECKPPDGTADGTNHWLTREIGDRRAVFTALWSGGMWHTIGTQPLSPYKAAWATWEYKGPAKASEPEP